MPPPLPALYVFRLSRSSVLEYVAHVRVLKPPQPRSSGSGCWVGLLIGVILLAGAAFAAWYFVLRSGSPGHHFLTGNSTSPSSGQYSMGFFFVALGSNCVVRYRYFPDQQWFSRISCGCLDFGNVLNLSAKGIDYSHRNRRTVDSHGKLDH